MIYMPTLLNNKIVLITGSGRGLGAEMAKLFAAHGAKVAVNYLAQTEQPRSLNAFDWL